MRNKVFQILGVSLLAICLFSGNAQAQTCDLSITSVREPSFTTYDPFDSQNLTAPFKIFVQNNLNTACTAALIVKTAGNRRLQHGGESIDYNLYFGSQRDIGDNRNSRNAYLFNIDGDEDRLELELEMSLRAGQIIGSGDYSQGVTLEIFEVANNAAGATLDTKAANLSVNVQPQIGITIAGTAGASYLQGQKNAVMDFGTLETGEEQSVHLKVRSNESYRMVFRSDNNGRLKNLDAANYYIDYIARLQGQVLNLSSGTDSYSNAGSTRIRGASHPLSVEIGNTENKAAGLYQDVMTIDVYPE